MPFYTVDRDSCTRCGLCKRLCPSQIIETDPEGWPQVEEERSASCIRCGQCVVFCPTSCNTLSFQTEKLPLVDEAFLPTPEAAEMLLRSRRSIRWFKKEELPRPLLLRLFETVRYAPSAQNLQAVRWVVLEKRAQTDEVERKVVEFFRGACEAPSPDMSSPLVNNLRSLVKRADAGLPVILRGAPQLAIAVMPNNRGWSEDGAIALTYLELAAHALGVGCCWGGYFTRAFRASKDLRASLGIRDDELVVGAQMLGYPAHSLARRLPPRKTPNLTWM